MQYDSINVDVLCVGYASYDLVFQVDHHPGPDEKTTAAAFLKCGGGPASNAAVTVSRLGLSSAFVGYLGNDEFGLLHQKELLKSDVNTDHATIGNNPIPLSSIIVKPDGSRLVVNHDANPDYLPAGFADEINILPRVILCDGHEPYISEKLILAGKRANCFTILDAGSVHEGTKYLLNKVDYIICSEKFAQDFIGSSDENALDELVNYSPNVIITRGEKPILWRNINGTGKYNPFQITPVDTSAAGDVFHGAFAYGLALKMEWDRRLRFAAAAAALSCTKMGGRTSIPTLQEVKTFLENSKV